MLVAEDSRGTSGDGIAPLLDGLSAGDAEVRRYAVRALGRMERDSLSPTIAGVLEDPVAHVRAEAANALAQSVMRGRPEMALSDLRARASVERDAAVRGALAEALGRIRHPDASRVADAAATLLELSHELMPAEGLLAVAKGMFFLARQPSARGALEPEVIVRLDELTRYGLDDDSEGRVSKRIRGLAMAALAAAGAATEERVAAVLEDPDPFVRREAALAAGAVRDSASARRLALRALDDSAPFVRYDGLRVLTRMTSGMEPCPTIRAAAYDANAHVALLAIDQLGARCAASVGVAELLDSLAATLPTAAPAAATIGRPVESGESWHAAAHALVSLAASSPQRARERLPAFASAANFFVRTYAAAAATHLRDGSRLLALAADEHPNVRTAALDGLRTVTRHATDSVYIAQLSSDDSQLLQAAAGALEGTLNPAAAPALLDALDRITEARRETSRDARSALLARVGELADASYAGRLMPYLSDFDTAIARQAAAVLEAWTGTRHATSPTAPPSFPLPTLAELRALEKVRMIIEMADGGTIELRLLPFDAPTNVARFVRLARAGYYDGLTFHRVAPNFVIQGGSPAANEYAGDGPFTRDELGLAGNWRGTVGLSTRGRDTGDAQLYINLVDNVRLDHDYTIWAEVASGMDVIDRVLEGAVMQRVFVR